MEALDKSAIEQQINNNTQTKGEYYLADAMQILLDQGLQMQANEVEVWKDCGKPESLLETNKYLLEHGHDNSAQLQVDGSVIVPPVNIHVDAKIHIEFPVSYKETLPYSNGFLPP